MSTFIKISKLVGECLNITDYYVNLDTGRKNKISTMNSKKNIHISHNFKVFSIDRTILRSNIEALQIVYSHIKPDIAFDNVGNSDDNTRNNIGDGFIPTIVSGVTSSGMMSEESSGIVSTSYDTVANAFNTINRLLVAPLLAEKLLTSSNHSRPTAEKLFEDMTPNLIQGMSSLNLSESFVNPSKYPTLKHTAPKYAVKRSTHRPKSLPAPKPKSQSKSQPKPKAQSKSRPKTQPKAQPKAQPKSRPKTQPKAQPKSRPKTQPKAQPKAQPKGIPVLTRNKVWREWCGNVMDGRCFCCEESIGYEKWHCGHVIARERGGSVDAENLRPTCTDCNLGMGTLHMYEWILMNRLPGYRHLDHRDPIVRYNLSIVEAAAKTGGRIEWLEENGHMTRTVANNYRRRIVSKRSDTRERVNVMEEVTGIYRLHNKL